MRRWSRTEVPAECHERIDLHLICYCRMRKVPLVACVLLVSVSSSEARHRHWHWHGHYVGAAPYAYGFAFPQDDLQRRRSQRVRLNPADMVPPNWQLQPPDSNWKGNRFLYPDGSSWLNAYASWTDTEPITSHMQSVAFAEGETVTYLRGQRDWIVVSGTKGDRIFYRKAVIACGGKVWHHVAFEYPITLKQQMDPFLIRAAAIVAQAENDGCQDAAASINPDR